LTQPLEVVTRIWISPNNEMSTPSVAGDIFDGPAPEEQWWKGLQNELHKRRWTRPVVLLPGNHDPLMPRSVFGTDHPFRGDLPKYVHVVDRDDFSLPIGNNAVILATPCRSHSGQSGLVSSIPQRPAGDERFRIGLIHGQTFDLAGFQTNFPIESGAAEARGLDYLAIGDTHAFRDVEPDARVPTVYPGAPEAMNFGEVDTGSVALVFFLAIVAGAHWFSPNESVRGNGGEDLQIDVEVRALSKDTGLRQTVLSSTST
jgi:DNA repair exonuclease SbcCD nuclease subunit